MTRITQAKWLDLSREANFRAERFARLVGVSLRQMERVFRAHGCLPPQAFLGELRLWGAADRLRDGGAPKEVAMELGFHSVSWFYHEFRHYHGCTPREFARIQRRRESDQQARLAELSLEGHRPLPDPAAEAQGRLIRHLMYLLKREPGRGGKPTGTARTALPATAAAAARDGANGREGPKPCWSVCVIGRSNRRGDDCPCR